MAEAQLQRFLEKVRQLNAFVALSEKLPELRRTLRDCDHHDQVVALARAHGFEIGRRWGEDSDPSPVHAPSLLSGPCPALGSESTTVLVHTPQLRLERIHSCSAITPEGRWYDQEETEWVTLLQGTALLRFEDEEEARPLKRGDAVLIAAGRRHRVEATDPPPGTIWLALFFHGI